MGGIFKPSFSQIICDTLRYFLLGYNIVTTHFEAEVHWKISNYRLRRCEWMLFSRYYERSTRLQNWWCFESITFFAIKACIYKNQILLKIWNNYKTRYESIRLTFHNLVVLLFIHFLSTQLWQFYSPYSLPQMGFSNFNFEEVGTRVNNRVLHYLSDHLLKLDFLYLFQNLDWL